MGGGERSIGGSTTSPGPSPPTSKIHTITHSDNQPGRFRPARPRKSA